MNIESENEGYSSNLEEGGDVDSSWNTEDAEEGDGDSFFSEGRMRHRTRIVTIVDPPPNTKDLRRRIVRKSEEHEREDCDERCLTVVITCVVICILLGIFAVRRLAFALKSPPLGPTPQRTQFDYVNHSSWGEFEKTRSKCTRPSMAEGAIWAETGEACANGACLEIDILLKTLEAHAKLDGEAYSTFGRTTRGVPLPCACAIRDAGGTVRSYLDPRLKERRGQLYKAEIEFDFFGGHITSLIIPQTVIVEYRAWPSGNKTELRAEDADAAQWVAAMFILNL